MCSQDVHSEMKDKFIRPHLKKSTATRSKHLEEFYWQEFYDEYIHYNNSLLNTKNDKSNTEYFEEFCKNKGHEDEAAKQALMNNFPLYSTRAITLWNQAGDLRKDFKKRSSITRPVDEQNEQFG